MDMSHTFAVHEAIDTNPGAGIFDKPGLLRFFAPARQDAQTARTAAQPDPAAIHADHLQNLEAMFEDYADAAISIDAYIARIKLEIEAIRAGFSMRAWIAATSLCFLPSYRQRLIRHTETLKAARWCLRWAEQRRQDEFNDCLAAASAKWLSEVQASEPAAPEAA
jgi:hypothetical protein